MSDKSDKKERMAESRKRAAGIDSYVDMIPARFYVGSESQQVHNSRGPGLDPSRAMTTSALVKQAAAAEAQKGGEDVTAGAGKGKNKNKKKSKNGGGAGKTPRDSGELKAKLQERIAELKEQRRQKQSAADKAKNAAAKAAAGGSAAPAKGLKGQDAPKAKDAPKEAKRKAPAADGDDFAEAGRLTFNTKSAAVPFEVGVGKRGAKMKRLKNQLRNQELASEKLAKAEKEGRGEEARRELELKNALKRARGEKVHDDTTKLRKAHKTLSVKKENAKQKWKDRVDKELQEGKEKQEKRKANLDAKRDKKREKKFGKRTTEED